ncbi:MAG TPA: alpha/beta hydrolase [Gemmatimonadaceae bacterium]|nr:alpha/beta hydrolase [Gemmatimonadaceae bacterium]
MTHLEYDWESPVWRHWLRELSNGHTLIRYDERGNGLSDRDAENLSFDSWISDLESVVDAAGLDRFPLFGISQGCAVAITYTVRHPERVTRLVLYGGFAQGVVARARNPAQLAEVKMIMEGIPLGWGYDNPAFRQFFAARFLPEGTPEQMRWFSELQRLTTSPEIGARLLTTASTIDVTDVLPHVKVPVLVLHATGDAVAAFGEGRKLAALLPNARFVPLESRNHILLEQEPAWVRFVNELRSFLAEDERENHSSSATRDLQPTAAAPPHQSQSSRRTTRR